MDAWIIRGLVSLKDDASSALDKVQGKFKQTNNQVEGSTSRLGGVLNKVAPIVAGAFAVNKIIDFGKQIVETTSEVNAMKAQFDQVFKQDAGNALDKINSQSKELNIHADRLQVSWNKFGAQIKGVGTDGPKALNMTEQATRLAADAAAYFDKDMSTASDSLASFMKGNFQAGDALGVFTNANDMSRYSVQKLGKKWQDLTEAQKQDMLLQKVEETYKLNGAMGQAAREADNWSNVTGNLKATWDGFLAKIGGPLLSVATKGVKLLTDGIGWLGDKLTSLDFSKLAESNPVIQAVKDTFEQNLPAIQQIFEYVMETISSIWNSVGLPIFEIMTKIVEEVVNVVKEQFPWIQETIATVIDLVTVIFENFAYLIQNFVIPVFTTMITWIQENWPLIQEVISTVMDYIKFRIEFVLNWIGTFWDNWGMKIFDMVGLIFTKIKDVIEAVLNVIKGIINIVLGVIQGDWSRVWEGIKQVVSGVWDAIKGIVSTAIEIVKTVLATAWAIIETTAITVWNVIKDKISSIWESIKSAVSSAINSVKTTVSDIWNSIKSTTENIWNGIKKAISDPIEAAKNKVRDVIEAIKGFFNFKISWPNIPVPHFGITPSGWKLGDLLKGSIPKLGITWNAEGGIFTKPTVLNTGAGLQGFGEAGKEAILPLHKLPKLLEPYFARKNETEQKTIILKTDVHIENFNNNSDSDYEEITERIAFETNEKLALIGG